MSAGIKLKIDGKRREIEKRNEIGGNWKQDFFLFAKCNSTLDDTEKQPIQKKK